MDALGDFLPFLLAVGYLLIRFVSASRRRAADPQAKPAPPPRRRKAGGPTPFEQLVARLEEQARESRPAPALPMEPPPVEPPPVAPPRRARPSDGHFDAERAAVAGYEARAAQASAFRPLGAGRADDRIGMASGGGFKSEMAGFSHERHGFGSDNPYSEEVFESSGARRPAPSDRLAYDPHGTPRPGTPASRRTLADRLTSPEALREAFVLQTILARPTPRRRP